MRSMWFRKKKDRRRIEVANMNECIRSKIGRCPLIHFIISRSRVPVISRPHSFSFFFFCAIGQVTWDGVLWVRTNTHVLVVVTPTLQHEGLKHS